jgi:hypothetical protein
VVEIGEIVAGVAEIDLEEMSAGAEQRAEGAAGAEEEISPEEGEGDLEEAGEATKGDCKETPEGVA